MPPSPFEFAGRRRELSKAIMAGIEEWHVQHPKYAPHTRVDHTCCPEGPSQRSLLRGGSLAIWPDARTNDRKNFLMLISLVSPAYSWSISRCSIRRHGKLTGGLRSGSRHSTRTSLDIVRADAVENVGFGVFVGGEAESVAFGDTSLPDVPAFGILLATHLLGPERGMPRIL